MKKKVETSSQPSQPSQPSQSNIASGNKQVVPTSATELTQDFAADAGAGTSFTGADLAIPFLVILQKNSPQVDADSGKYVQGAAVGMIYNTVTGELFDGKKKGIVVVPTGYHKAYVEWKKRDDGGGFVAQHEPGSQAVKQCRFDEKNKLETPDGHQMIETAYHYVVLVSDGGLQWAVISMASSQLKKSRKWNTLISGIVMSVNGKPFRPPVFAHRYRLKTTLETKDQNTWYGWEIAMEGVVADRDEYAYAKAYYTALRDGAVRVGTPPVSSEEVDESEPTPF